MIRFLRIVVIAVVAILLLLFAVANRQIVTVSFDPFGSDRQPRLRDPRRRCLRW